MSLKCFEVACCCCCVSRPGKEFESLEWKKHRSSLPARLFSYVGSPPQLTPLLPLVYVGDYVDAGSGGSSNGAVEDQRDNASQLDDERNLSVLDRIHSSEGVLSHDGVPVEARLSQRDDTAEVPRSVMKTIPESDRIDNIQRSDGKLHNQPQIDTLTRCHSSLLMLASAEDALEKTLYCEPLFKDPVTSGLFGANVGNSLIEKPVISIKEKNPPRGSDSPYAQSTKQLAGVSTAQNSAIGESNGGETFSESCKALHTGPNDGTIEEATSASAPADSSSSHDVNSYVSDFVSESRTSSQSVMYSARSRRSTSSFGGSRISNCSEAPEVFPSRCTSRSSTDIFLTPRGI